MQIEAAHADPASPLSAPIEIPLVGPGWSGRWDGCVSREGYMLLATDWTAPAGAEDVHELDITVSQHHRDWTASYRLHRAAGARVGVEFYTDGTPWALLIAVRRIDGNTPGATIRLAPMTMHIAVVDVNDAPAAYDFSALTQPRANVPITLFNANQGGLMNRLVSLFSVIETATRLGCVAKGWWAPNAHCAASFSDLFDLEASRIVPAAAQATVPEFNFYYNYLPGAPPLALAGTTGTQIVHSTAPLQNDAVATTSWQAVGDTFRQMTLSAPIRRKLHAFEGMDFSRTIGFHIRRPYPNGAFAEQEQAKFALGEQLFVNLLEDLRSHQPEFDHALICTNDPALEARLADHFGNYVFSFAKESIDNTAEPLAVQEAIVDVMLLARCPILFSQSTSSFAVVASAIGRNRLFCLTPESTATCYDIWQFDTGQHRANLTIPRSEFDRLSAQIEEPAASSRVPLHPNGEPVPTA